MYGWRALSGHCDGLDGPSVCFIERLDSDLEGPRHLGVIQLQRQDVVSVGVMVWAHCF